MSDQLRIAVLLSGTGRSLQNLLDRITAGSLNARIVLVISDRTVALGLSRANDAGIRTEIVSHSAQMSDQIFSLCRETKVQLVCMAGFLRLLKIPADFTGRVLNIHPSLLPAFGGRGMYGMRVHQAVIAAGVAESGCTVHFADDIYDHGPVLLQKRVSVLPGDTPASLADRVFAAECDAYPQAIQLWMNRSMK